MAAACVCLGCFQHWPLAGIQRLVCPPVVLVGGEVRLQPLNQLVAHLQQALNKVDSMEIGQQIRRRTRV